MSNTENDLNSGVNTPQMTGTSGEVDATDARLAARCKWFNNKAGNGFVTVTTGEHNGTDVFVHHTGISVTSEQYRYLVQGEYVEVSMIEMTDGDHKWQANDVRGISGGLLMCETRNEARESRGDEGDEDVSAHRHTSGRRGGDHRRGSERGGDHRRGSERGGERGCERGGERGGERGARGGDRGPRVQRYRVRGPGPREEGEGNEVWELVRTSKGDSGHGQDRA